VTRLTENSLPIVFPRFWMRLPQGKGGHLQGVAAEFLYDGWTFREFGEARIDTKIRTAPDASSPRRFASGLPKGKSVPESVAAAKEFITAAIRSSLAMGKG